MLITACNGSCRGSSSYHLSSYFFYGLLAAAYLPYKHLWCMQARAFVANPCAYHRMPAVGGDNSKHGGKLQTGGCSAALPQAILFPFPFYYIDTTGPWRCRMVMPVGSGAVLSWLLTVVAAN